MPDGIDAGDPKPGDLGLGRRGGELGRDRDAPADADEADRRSDVVDRGGQPWLEAGRHAHARHQAAERGARAEHPRLVRQARHGADGGARERMVPGHAEHERVLPEDPFPQALPGRGAGVAVARQDDHVEFVAADGIGPGLVRDGGEPDLHVGEPPAHLGERAAHDLRPLAERDANPEQPGDPARAGQRRLRRAQLHDDPLGVLDEVAARRGEGDPVAGPLHQGGAGLALQRGQLLGDRRPGVLQATGRRGDGALGGHGPEHDKSANVEHNRHFH